MNKYQQEFLDAHSQYQAMRKTVESMVQDTVVEQHLDYDDDDHTDQIADIYTNFYKYYNMNALFSLYIQTGDALINWGMTTCQRIIPPDDIALLRSQGHHSIVVFTKLTDLLMQLHVQ